MKQRLVIIMSIVTITLFIITVYYAKNKPVYKIDLANLTLTEKENIESIRTYSINDFELFLDDYKNNNLPRVYITKFLFDGVSMYRTYDLTDYIENYLVKGIEYEPEILEITNINFHEIGRYELSGKIDSAMVSVNTNNLEGKVTLFLNNASIDTKSKKVPVVYVYNKDINYTKAKVIISSLPDTKNYLEGGKLKKVSLISKEELDLYSNNYVGENKESYEAFSNYYGVYSKDEIDNILFAKVKASNEDLQDGDPYYFYKAAGAISSDIDLYFSGKGYLEINSKNKEGVETKGNLSLLGGSGDYVIHSFDDGLNTTTKSSEENARNQLTIDVKSLSIMVDLEADEGDAIDSNGELYIYGGRIMAIAHPGADAGIDSEKGTYIMGGEIIATGDMYDEIKADSKQKVLVLSFTETPQNGEIIALTDNNSLPIFAYKTDRTYQNLVYSSPKLEDKNYYLFKIDSINGTDTNGVYSEITSLNGAIQLAYANKNMFFGGINPGVNPPTDNNDFTVRIRPNEDEPPQDMKEDIPERIPGEMPKNDYPNPPDNFSKGQDRPMDDNEPPMDFQGKNNMEFKASNKDFTISDIINVFNGIAIYNVE